MNGQSGFCLWNTDLNLTLALKKAAADADSFDNACDAEVWLASKDASIAETVLALIQVESHFHRYAESSVGAQGIMQIMPFWKQEIGRPDNNLDHTPTNLRYGCNSLKYYLLKVRSSIVKSNVASSTTIGLVPLTIRFC